MVFSKGLNPFTRCFTLIQRNWQKPDLIRNLCYLESCAWWRIVCTSVITVAEFTSRFSPDEINTINLALNTVLTTKYTY